MKIKIVTSDFCPDGQALLISGEPSAAGRAEIAARVRTGEAEELVWADVMAREKKLASVKFDPQSCRRAAKTSG